MIASSTATSNGILTLRFTVVDPATSLRYLEIRGIVRIADAIDLAVRDTVASTA